jgi:hypothetical protein
MGARGGESRQFSVSESWSGIVFRFGALSCNEKTKPKRKSSSSGAKAVKQQFNPISDLKLRPPVARYNVQAWRFTLVLV